MTKKIYNPRQNFSDAEKNYILNNCKNTSAKAIAKAMNDADPHRPVAVTNQQIYALLRCAKRLSENHVNELIASQKMAEAVSYQQKVNAALPDKKTKHQASIKYLLNTILDGEAS